MNQTELLEILRDQKEELRGFSRQVFCSRAEEAQIKLDSKKAQVVIGVRRSGKSVLCYNALNKAGVSYAYVNFDDERLVKLSSEELNDVLRCLYQIYGDFSHLFLDEIQNIDLWHLFVNRLLRQGVKVILAGSNAKLLSSELSTHLTGRYNEIRLYPFSFQEYCLVKEINTFGKTTKEDALLRKAFDDYINMGGFPEVVKEGENPEEYIDGLVFNVLQRDIIQRYKIRYKDAFVNLSNHLMNNSPCELVYTTLQKQFNFKTDHTVENYVDYLCQAYLLLRLKKYSPKSSIRMRNSKCYTVDVALLNARKDVFSGEAVGWRLETIVYIELNRRYAGGYDIYYFKKSGYEADFVICHRKTVLEILQVSYSISNPKTLNREINGLIKASKATSCNKLTLITAYEERLIEAEGTQISVMPCYKWLLE